MEKLVVSYPVLYIVVKINAWQLITRLFIFFDMKPQSESGYSAFAQIINCKIAHTMPIAKRRLYLFF